MNESPNVNQSADELFDNILKALPTLTTEEICKKDLLEGFPNSNTDDSEQLPVSINSILEAVLKYLEAIKEGSKKFYHGDKFSILIDSMDIRGHYYYIHAFLKKIEEFLDGVFNDIKGLDISINETIAHGAYRLDDIRNTGRLLIESNPKIDPTLVTQIIDLLQSLVGMEDGILDEVYDQHAEKKQAEISYTFRDRTIQIAEQDETDYEELNFDNN